MPARELTDRFIQTAKTKSGRKTDFFDLTARNLCLRVTAAGAKGFYFVYGPAAKRQWMRLGPYPAISLAVARQKARDARAAVSEGKDPIADKKAFAASQTVKDMVENYVARHAATKRSSDEIARRLRKNISGYDEHGNLLEHRSTGTIGDIKLADLHRRDITKAIDAIVDRGARTEANRVFEDVRAMIRWARGRGDLDENLSEGMQRPAEASKRDRVLSSDEIRTMWTTLPEADMRESTRRIIRLCIVTAQRVGEISRMELDEVDFDRAIWTIPAARAKNGQEHVVPLSDMALDIIRAQLDDVAALARRKQRNSLPWVFPGPGGHAATTPASVPKALKREEIDKKNRTTILGINPWTPHDLRRSAATGMQEVGISPFIVGHILNHASVTKATVTLQVYATYSYEKEKREALNLWADRLSGIIAGGRNVISLARAQL
jgi:integrase